MCTQQVQKFPPRKTLIKQKCSEPLKSTKGKRLLKPECSKSLNFNKEQQSTTHERIESLNCKKQKQIINTQALTHLTNENESLTRKDSKSLNSNKGKPHSHATAASP
uniref:Uncharacterized protein n=1 Tax=Cacopsylla melanoneura TaxID=428564 RepID=A0A8D8M0M6_9HEMI